MNWVKLTTMISLSIIWNLNAVYGQSTEQAYPPGHTETSNIYFCPNHHEVRASWPAKCPLCGETLIRQTQQQQSRQTPSDNARASWMRRNMMLYTSIDVFDPEAILSARRVLDLTQKQIEKLREISRNARESAIKVLTEEQRKELRAAGNLPNYPRTMAQMHRRMLQRIPASDAAILNLMLQRRNTQERDRTNDPPAQTPQLPEQSNATIGDVNAPAVVGSVNAINAARDQMRDRYRDQYSNRYQDQNRNGSLYRFYYYQPYNYGYTYSWPYYWPYTWPYSYEYIYPQQYYNGYPYPYNYYYYPY